MLTGGRHFDVDAAAGSVTGEQAGQSDCRARRHDAVDADGDLKRTGGGGRDTGPLVDNDKADLFLRKARHVVDPDAGDGHEVRHRGPLDHEPDLEVAVAAPTPAPHVVLADVPAVLRVQP